MKYILNILLLFNGIYSFGQVAYSNQNIIINGHRLEIIQSTFFMNVMPSDCHELDTFSIIFNNDTADVNLYYDAMGAFIGGGCLEIDTIYTDSLPIGSYTFIFHVHQIIGFIDARDTLFNQALDTTQIIITNDRHIDLSSFISLYPNPVQQYLDIEVKGFSIQSLYLFNSQGQLIREIPEGMKRLDLRHLASGFYFFKIKTNKGWVTKKVIKR